MSLPEALKLLRLELGMTQTDLAHKLNKAYITVSRWENGKGFPSRSNSKDILHLAKKLNASEECVSYLYDILVPDVKRVVPASSYGFPDIDREFLFQLADGSANSLYVIEKNTYKLLYANRMAEKEAVRYLRATGNDVTERALINEKDKRCFHYFANQAKPCSFCPLKDFQSREFINKVLSFPDLSRKIQIHAQSSEMNGRDVYVIYLTDITEYDKERSSLYEMTNDILDGVGIYHVYFDGSVELEFMNTAFYQMLGRKRGIELEKSKCSEFRSIHPDDREHLRYEIKKAIEENRNIQIDIRMNVANKGYCNLHLSGRMLRKDSKKITFYCLFRKKK